MGTKQSSGRKKKDVPKGGRWIALWWVVVLAPVTGLLAMLLLAAGSKDLPSTGELQNPRSDLATAVLFSDGSIMGQYYRENRIPVGYDHISPYVVHALVATEDERFRAHSGIDLRGTARAAVFLVKRGGASTSTQQLAKIVFTSQERKLSRKLKELMEKAALNK